MKHSLADRAEAEAAEIRLAFLAEAGTILAGSLELTEALENLARLAVTFLTDLCFIDLLEDDGSIHRVAAVHADPEKQELARALGERYPPSADKPTPAVRVLRTGEPEYRSDMSSEFLEATTQDEEHLRLVRELGFTSYISVPLVARAKVLGSFSLISTTPARRYGPVDVSLVGELARRAALAVDNARLFEAERAARTEAESARSRLAFLALASEVLASSLDEDVILQNFARLAVPRLADWCAVDLVVENGSLRRMAAVHVDPELEGLVHELRERYPPDPAEPHPIWSVILTGQPDLAEFVSDADLVDRARDADHLDLLRRLGIRSHMVLPIKARGKTFGAVSLVSGASGRHYVPADLELAVDLARRAALAADNARLYREQRHIARTLQQSLLPPSLPELPGIEVAARYRAAGEGNEVGGDFYDVFEASDQAWVVTIGDVCGKGPEAAAVTGLARHTVRAAAIHERRPSAVLSILNDAILRELSDQRFITVCCVRVRPNDEGARLTICSAGHPLPLVLRAEGGVETVGRPSMLLGVFPDVELTDHVVDLGPGDALVLYTDGVTEPMSVGLDVGADQLASVVASAAGRPAAGIAQAIEQAVEGVAQGTRRDDLAVLVLRANP
jgi:serine phosphatase RsbU (regulator of sigma subunit)